MTKFAVELHAASAKDEKQKSNLERPAAGKEGLAKTERPTKNKPSISPDPQPARSERPEEAVESH